MNKIAQLTSLGLYKFTKKLCHEIKVIVPLLALAIFILNSSLSKNAFTVAKENILANKNSPNAHHHLGNLFLTNNQYDLAEKEAALAISKLKNSTKQKTFQSFLEKVTKAKNLETKILEEHRFWIKLTNSYPVYRDAYIKAAIFSLKQGRSFEAKKYIEMASYLDKNYPIIQLFQNEVSVIKP